MVKKNKKTILTGLSSLIKNTFHLHESWCPDGCVQVASIQTNDNALGTESNFSVTKRRDVHLHKVSEDSFILFFYISHIFDIFLTSLIFGHFGILLKPPELVTGLFLMNLIHSSAVWFVDIWQIIWHVIDRLGQFFCDIFDILTSLITPQSVLHRANFMCRNMEICLRMPTTHGGERINEMNRCG